MEKIEYDNYKIVIIDNMSTNNSERILREKFESKHKIIQTGKNIGYAAGNNIGIKYAMDHNSDYVCILNNDTIVSTHFLINLVDYLEHNKKCAMVGPAILDNNENHTIQSTGALIDISKGKVPVINNGKLLRQVDDVINCDYIGGACILARCDVIKIIGMLPECYFLFFEETEWCYRAKKAGFTIKCYTKSNIVHKGSVAINSINGLNQYLLERNRMVFVKRNGDLISKIKFCIYVFVKGTYMMLFNRKQKCFLKYYLHGLFNIVDKQYPFIYINKNQTW